MSEQAQDEGIPDPFQLGDDDLDDEHPDSRHYSVQTPDDIGTTYEARATKLHSAQQSREDLIQALPEKSTPPLPPKQVQSPGLDDPPPRPHLIGNLHALMGASLFLPIPESDPLTSLLVKYTNPDVRPRRDLSGEYGHSDLPTLITTNSWRATARLARDQLLACSPNDVVRIFELWSLRLNSLARLRLYNQTVAECSALFTAISTIQPPESREYIIRELLPLDLELHRARLKYWANDQLGYVDALMHVIKKCRHMAKRSKVQEHNELSTKWLDNASKVSVILASQLVEMKQYTTAIRLLETMLTAGSPSPALRSTLALICLQIGDYGTASRHLEILEADHTSEQDIVTSNAILKACFAGDWDRTVELISSRKDTLSADQHVLRAIDANNLSVALLNKGQLSEGIAVLEETFRVSPSIAAVAEVLIFNLATMYELKSNTAMEKKIGLLLQVAQWSGDGVRHTTLKLG